MKQPAIQFPKTPEHPTRLNAELQYRLEFLRMLDRCAVEAEKSQENLPNSAFAKAGTWIHEWLIKGARESLDRLGPLSSAAQKAELKEFVDSLGSEAA